MGSEFFNQVQYGKEPTKGTSVAATRLWIGQMPAIKTDRKPVYPKEHFGMRADAMRSVIHQYLYMNSLSSEHGCFEHLPVLFGCGVKGGVTATQQTTSQGDYLWNFTPSLTGANSPDALTLRMGDDSSAWISEYCMFERIRISGQVAQGQDSSPVSVEADFFGRQIASGSFTAGQASPNLEPMNAKLSRLYLDTSWAGVGGTLVSDVLRTFDIEIITGVHPKFAGSTARTFNSHAEGIISVTGTFTVEGGSSANTIFANQQANTLAVARLELQGSQIGTGLNHRLRIDFSGTYEDASPIASADRGDNLSTFVLHNFYDKTGAKSCQFEVVTDINAY